MTTQAQRLRAAPEPTGAAPHLVETSGLTKRYGPTLAVDGVSLAVRRGEVYGFLGPNGAGKTTTLRILLGLIRPSAGTVRVLGHPPGHPAGLARIGALVEDPTFYPYLSGRDNLAVLAGYAGAPAERIGDALATVGLSDRADDRYTTYSMGMKQRLGVAAALVKDPVLLILDEPTNGLDPAGMADMRALLRRLASEGHTVLLSSHLLGEVQQVCDRVGVISRGKLIAESTVEELRGRGALEVTADPLDTALQCAERLLGPDRVWITEGGRLRADAGPDDAARLNRTLVHADVTVSELRRVERTLEEVFLEMTSTEES